MFNKIFRKDAPATTQAVEAPAAPPKVKRTATAAEIAAWQAKLDAAVVAADDTALLALAREKAPLKIRLAAIVAITSEEGLKAAEREFREHDRSLHREAKRLYEARVNARETAAEAARLIAQLQQLQDMQQADTTAAVVVPANRVVEVDRQWNALNTERARGDQQLLVRRWTEASIRAVAELAAGSAAVAETGLERDKLGQAYEAVNKLVAETPQFLADDILTRDVAHQQAELETALNVARALDARLSFLDKFLDDHAHGAVAAWNALPVVADAKVAALLQTRFDVLRRHRDDAANSAKREATAKVSAEERATRDAKLGELETQIAAAETALAGGHIVEASAALATIEATQKGLSLNTKMQNRIGEVRAEIMRLKGWQHWGGGRVREDLVEEAAVLARAITDEKLNVRAHADNIEKLRERWKELDKLGGATNRELWTAFDSALKTAFLPVSAMQAKAKAVRQDNLALRNALIATLDKVSIGTAEARPDYRELARALEHFQTEWRKQGPLQHTVPHKAQDALTARMQQAVARVETPLNEARRVEAAKREKLIARAKEIAADTKSRDTITRVRDLQAEWQREAKSLPLARNVENKLWGEFKAATDAIFQARDAANAARDQAFQQGATEREQLIAKLAALTADSAPHEIRKTLADVEQAWRRAGEAPRAVAQKIEREYRAARDTAQQFAAGSAKRAWQKVCAALQVRIALCVNAEGGDTANAQENFTSHLEAEGATEWDALLQKRLSAAIQGNATQVADADDVLLKLEAALEIDSPPAFQAARREMKLRAMKAAIEARQSVTVTDAEVKSFIGAVIGAKMAETQQSMRLSSILTALQQRPLR
jgi:DNA repair protein SbcC/Rad50